MIRSKKKLILLGILLSTSFFACSKSQSFQEDFKLRAYSNIEDGYSPNPLLENLPHSDIGPSVIPLSEVNAVNPQWPATVKLLYNYLNGTHDNLSFIKLSELVSDIDNFHVISVNDSLIVFLDEDKNRLIQYDIGKNEYIELATAGRGPGDILFARDLAYYENNLYVSMQANRISKFDCSQIPCKYSETIQTEFNNQSVSPANDGLYIIGLSPIRSVETTTDDINNYSAHYLNVSGDTRKSFIPRYEHVSLMVKEAIDSRGYINRTSINNNIYIGFSLTPFLYNYSSDNHQLVKKILIPNYEQGFYDYNSNRGTGHTRSIDRTMMTYMEEISEKWIVYQLKHFDYISDNERRSWYSYYFFDIENQQIYKLGEDDKLNRSVFVAEHGLMINQEGELIWMAGK